MGQSTDADLFYGYCWNEEDFQLFDDVEDSDDEWDEILARREGHESPWDLYRASGAEAEHEGLPYEERHAAYQTWKQAIGFDDLYDEWTVVREEIKARYGGVDISSHCSCDFPMPYIYITDSRYRASRGFPVHLDLRAIAAGPAITWDLQLKRFTDDLGIDLAEAEGPGWFLVSNWC